MKHILATTLCVTLCSAPFGFSARAADQLYSSAPTTQWAGAYVGGQIGGGWGNYDYVFSDGENVGSSLSGVIGGALAGYNWQLGTLVVGVEGDLSGAGISGSSVCPNPSFSCDASVDWLGTLRGRLGMPINRFLPYVTAGVAFGGMTRTSASAGNSLKQSSTHNGWTIGGGVDFAQTDKWVIGGEILYVDLDGNAYSGASVGGSTFSEVTIGSQFTVVRVRAAFRFP